MGDGALPVRLTLETRGSRPVFSGGPLSVAVFDLVAAHPATVAACLLPTRLDWLLADGLLLAENVGRFRSRSAELARRHGHRGRLWRRCRWSHPARRGEDLRELAASIVEAPRRHGLVGDPRDYPLSVLRRGHPALGALNRAAGSGA